MFSKVTPRGPGQGIRSWMGQTLFAPRPPGQGVLSQWAMLSRLGIGAALSFCANGNVPDVSDLFVGQSASSAAFVANRANANLDFWTNNAQRMFINAGGGVTVNVPTGAGASSLIVNGGFGNGGLTAFVVQGAGTNQITASFTGSQTSSSQSAFNVQTGVSNDSLNINGDGSFRIGSNTVNGGGLFSGNNTGGFQWNQSATVIAALANNGGFTLNTATLASALANQINCNGYQVVGWSADSATTAASAAINTTETYVTASYVANGGAAAAAAQAWKITAYGTCTSTVANVSTFTPRMGTAGTTADTALTTLTCTAAASGTTIPFIYECWITIRTTGTPGTVWSYARLINQGVTGISATQIVLNTGASTSVTTSGTQHIGMSYKSAATTTTSTFQSVIVERLF